MFPDPSVEREGKLCVQHQDVNNPDESTSQILLPSHFSVHQKDHSKTPRKFISNNKFGWNLNSYRTGGLYPKPSLGKCSSRRKQNSRSTCPFLNAECSKCGKVRHIQSIFRNTKTCYSKSSDSHPPRHHLSLCNQYYSRTYFLFITCWWQISTLVHNRYLQYALLWSANCSGVGHSQLETWTYWHYCQIHCHL